MMLLLLLLLLLWRLLLLKQLLLLRGHRSSGHVQWRSSVCPRWRLSPGWQ